MLAIALICWKWMKQISYSGGEGVMEHKFLVMKGTDILVYISSHQGESEDHSEKQRLMY